MLGREFIVSFLIPQDIGRVMLNLINNTFYAVHERNKMNDQVYKPEVILETNRSNKGVMISVANNGKGHSRCVQGEDFPAFFYHHAYW